MIFLPLPLFVNFLSPFRHRYPLPLESPLPPRQHPGGFFAELKYDYRLAVSKTPVPLKFSPVRAIKDFRYRSVNRFRFLACSAKGQYLAGLTAVITIL